MCVCVCVLGVEGVCVCWEWREGVCVLGVEGGCVCWEWREDVCAGSGGRVCVCWEWREGVCVLGVEGGCVCWGQREGVCAGSGGRDVCAGSGVCVLGVEDVCVRLKGCVCARFLLPQLQAREHFCQVIQVLKKKHQTDTQQEQDSITVYTGTFNMGERHTLGQTGHTLGHMGVGIACRLKHFNQTEPVALRWSSCPDCTLHTA